MSKVGLSLRGNLNADAVRMLSSPRHALKYHHLVACLPEPLATGSYCRSYSKSTATSAVSKPTITKKKYSELPSLHPLCQTTPNAVLGSETASNTHRARDPSIRECASLPHCMLSVKSLCAHPLFIAGISNLSSTDSQPLPPYELITLEPSSTQPARRRRVRRKDNAEDASITESTERSNLTPVAPVLKQKRGRKTSSPTLTGELCE